MKKDLLRAKLIDFQKQIVTLSQELQAGERRCKEREERLYLELVAVLDAFENVFKNLQARDTTLDKPMQRALKSFMAIERKLVRVLEQNGVERLEFPDGKAEIGLCQVVERRDMQDAEDGTILDVVHHGYRCGERILRPAEVITAAKATDMSTSRAYPSEKEKQ